MSFDNTSLALIKGAFQAWHEPISCLFTSMRLNLGTSQLLNSWCNQNFSNSAGRDASSSCPSCLKGGNHRWSNGLISKNFVDFFIDWVGYFGHNLETMYFLRMNFTNEFQNHLFWGKNSYVHLLFGKVFHFYCWRYGQPLIAKMYLAD